MRQTISSRAPVALAVLGALIATASLVASAATAAAAQESAAPLPPPADASKTTRLQGRAFVDRNNHVVGAGVVVRPSEDPTRVALTTTDALGLFRIDGLPDGEYDVSVSRAGFAPILKRAVRVQFPFRAVVELQMQPDPDGAMPAAGAAAAGPAGPGADVAVEGRALDREGAPVAEVRVRVVHPDGTLDPRRAVTGADGAFRFEGLAPGAWRLETRAVGFLPIRREIDFRTDTRMQIQLVPQPADYEPTPLELMPEERPIPPESLDPGISAAG